MQQVKSLRRMGHPLDCHKLVVGKQGALFHRNMSDSFFPLVNKIKNSFWSPVDVLFLQGPYQQVSKKICFTALCFSFKTLSYLLVPWEIPSGIFGSHLSEYDLAYDENLNISIKHQVWRFRVIV